MRLCELGPLFQKDSEISQAIRGIGMFRSQDLLPDRQRPTVERLRLRVVALVREEKRNTTMRIAPAISNGPTLFLIVGMNLTCVRKVAKPSVPRRNR